MIYLYFVNFRIDLIPVYWAAPIYVALALSFVSLFLPMEMINKKLCKLDLQIDDDVEYAQAEESFDVTYEMLNPAYVCKKKRKRDKMLLMSIFGKMDELSEVKTTLNEGSKPIKEALLSPYAMKMNINMMNGNVNGNEVNPALLLLQPNQQDLVYRNMETAPKNPYSVETGANLFDVLFQGQQANIGFNNDRYF